ncbi:hypothetical protein [uncultured Lactobacillus sp.]|uniref:hypothetical protein n=1 Tax=uncultured Lactobacillus sp. TaxID=153152 RepID=UPI002610850B|nr:hypothetical protein [uncultured Lactobacillus sp.]
MNGNISDHMNKTELKHWFSERKFSRRVLYFELAYVIVLLFTLLFDFKVFMHLIAFQAIAILIYYSIGAFLDRGIVVKKRDTFWETITSIKFTKTVFLRLFEFMLFWTNIGVSVAFARQLWTDILQKPLTGNFANLLENAWLVGDGLIVVLLFCAEVGILGGNRKLLKVASVLTFILSLFLLWIQPSMQLAAAIGLVVSGANFGLSFCRKI